MINKYYIFRHGGTFATKTNTPYGEKIITAHILPESDPPLERLANYLKSIPSDLNVSSEFIRCVETVNVVSKISGKQFIFDKRLNEYNQETFEQLKNRVADFLKEVNQKDYRSIIICTHGGVISALVHLITQGRFTEDQLYEYPNPGVLLCIENNQITSLDFNQK